MDDESNTCSLSLSFAFPAFCSIITVESLAFIRQQMIVYETECLSIATLSKHSKFDLGLYGMHTVEDLTEVWFLSLSFILLVLSFVPFYTIGEWIFIVSQRRDNCQFEDGKKRERTRDDSKKQK